MGRPIKSRYFNNTREVNTEVNSSVVDVNFQQLYFDYASHHTNIAGDGKSNGNQVLWTNLITVNGVTVDALVTTTLSGATVTKYGDGTAGAAGDFRVNIKNSSATSVGSATFTFAFYKSGGVYTPAITAEPVELVNVQVTTKDIDANQFNSFAGARGYTISLSPTSTLDITKTPNDATWPAALQFQATATGDRTDLPEDQAVVSFSSITTTDVQMGRNELTTLPSFFALTWKFVSFGDATTESEGLPATVTYDLNGGMGTTPSPVTSVFGEIVGTVDTGAGVTREGYTFLGWFTSPNGTGTYYVPGAALTLPAADTTLYANWAIANTVAVSANITGAGAKAGDIVKQESSRRYSVITPDGISQCTLVASAPGVGQVNIFARDSAGGLYYVTKITARRAMIVKGDQTGIQFTTGADGISVPWVISPDTAVANVSVEIVSN